MLSITALLGPRDGIVTIYGNDFSDSVELLCQEPA